MATTAYAPTYVADTVPSASRPRLFSRLLARMVRSREIEARRRIASYSYLISDEDLNNIGLTREELLSWHRL